MEMTRVEDDVDDTVNMEESMMITQHDQRSND